MTNNLTANIIDIHTMLRLSVQQVCQKDESDPTWFSHYVLDFGPLGREHVTIEINFGEHLPREGEVWLVEVLTACPSTKTAWARACHRVS